MTKKREELLDIYRNNTGGKVTHDEKVKEPSDNELTGYQPARTHGIRTLGSGCQYGS
jgi:hypothetical protein